jgi:hypothetical protein
MVIRDSIKFLVLAAVAMAEVWLQSGALMYLHTQVSPAPPAGPAVAGAKTGLYDPEAYIRVIPPNMGNVPQPTGLPDLPPPILSTTPGAGARSGVTGQDGQPATASPAASGISLANWKLTLPIDADKDSKPDEIMPKVLTGFTGAPYFQASGGGLAFQAYAGGFTTKNSSYPRSELREMSGDKLASWSNGVGTHTMTIRQAITDLPAAKPHVVAGQIHDASDDVIMIRLEGSHLFVEGDGNDLGTLDDNYMLGSVFTVRIVASEGRIRVFYDDVAKVDYAKSGSGYYFKAGCYTQSNTSKGDSASAFGRVVIYSLSVSHT